MTLFESILTGLGIFPPSGLVDSMKESKTLTIMVIISLILFASFIFFLYKMAGAQG